LGLSSDQVDKRLSKKNIWIFIWIK
jgi:hypothetical protein